MANLIRHAGYDQLFDDLFKGFFVRPVQWDAQNNAPQIKVDVTEQKDAYLVHAEIPGVKREDISVEIDGNTVAIAAEIKKEKQINEGDRVLKEERFYGAVSRRFQLGSEIDDQSASARYENGVLELTLPKKQAEAAKRLTIQ